MEVRLESILNKQKKPLHFCKGFLMKLPVNIESSNQFKNDFEKTLPFYLGFVET